MPGVAWASAFLLVLALIATSEPRERNTGDSVYLGKVPKLEQTITTNGNVNLLCLNGVQYWYFGGSRKSQSLAPKYSPGHTWPDKCDGTERVNKRLVKE